MNKEKVLTNIITILGLALLYLEFGIISCNQRLLTFFNRASGYTGDDKIAYTVKEFLNITWLIYLIVSLTILLIVNLYLKYGDEEKKMNKEKEIIININGKEVPLSKLPCNKCEWRYSIHCPKCEMNKDGKIEVY